MKITLVITFSEQVRKIGLEEFKVMGPANGRTGTSTRDS